MAKQAASPRPSKMPPAPTSSDVSDGGMKIFYPPEKSERSPKGSNQPIGNADFWYFYQPTW